MAELCSECGAELPSGAAFGNLCPPCLLRLGLPESSNGEADQQSSVEVAPIELSADDSDSAFLTLPSDVRSSGRATLVRGAAPQIASETDSLLRSRLQVGALVILFGAALFVVRDIGNTEGTYPWLPRLVVLVFYIGAAILLYSRVPLGPRRLRAMEWAIFWVFALWFATDRFHYTHLAVSARDAKETLWAIAFSVMVYFAFLSAYGFFIPNTWRRALKMTGLMAATPMAVLVALAWWYPAEDAEFMITAASRFQISSMAFTLLIGVVNSTYGAHRIHALRQEVFEARQLGQYRLTERIGRGGMGEVWKAEHRLLVRPAAIKLVKPEMVDERDPAVARDVLSSFKREAQTTALLRSTHTVELYDFGVTRDSAFYYVMELLDGLDLETLVRRHGPLRPARAVYLLEQACDSLADAHEHGLIHRDIKPANIYICRMGRQYDFVKVLDFGLVKSLKRGQRSGGFGATKGLVVGTPSYMAPEMASSEAVVDGRTDIYALGCVGYWMLTGSRVFEGGTPGEIVAHHIGTEADLLSSRAEQSIPGSLEQIIMQCLAKDPGERPQTAEEMARMLSASGLSGMWAQDDAREWWQNNVEGSAD